MKRSTKQLLSMLLAIVMVVGLMAPAMAAKPMMGEVAETPAAAEAPAASRPAAKAPAKADLAAAGDKSTLDFGTVTAFAKGSAPAEGSSSADGKIKAIYGADGYVDTNKKSFDDGTEGTQRYRQGASTLTGTLADVIELKPTGRVVLKVWWVYNKGDREMAVYKLDGETVNTTTPVWTSGTGADNKLMISRINLPEAGTYYIGFPKNASDKAGDGKVKLYWTAV